MEPGGAGETGIRGSRLPASLRRTPPLDALAFVSSHHVHALAGREEGHREGSGPPVRADRPVFWSRISRNTASRGDAPPSCRAPPCPC